MAAHQAQPDVAGRRSARSSARSAGSERVPIIGRVATASHDHEPASTRATCSLPWALCIGLAAAPRRRASSSRRDLLDRPELVRARGQGVPGADRRPGAAGAQGHRRGAGADPGRGGQSEDRPLVGRHRRPVPPGRRARPARRLPARLPGRPARLGGAAVRDERQPRRRLLHQRDRLRLERGRAEEEEPAAAEVLVRPDRPEVQGRDRDLAPRLERHRLHHPRRPGADDGRGCRRSTT